MVDFQRDQDVVAYEGFKGLRNDVLPQRFSIADLAIAQNIDIDESGGISRRTGRTSKYAGVVHSLWAEGSLGLFMEGGNLKRLNTDYTATTMRSGLAVLPAMRYQKVNDTVYFTNGQECGLVERGVARSWGIAVPPPPGAAATVGNMPAGDYQFAMTYLRADGQESGTGLAGRISVPDGSGLNFTMPTSSDPNVAMKALYLTTPNGEILYRALVQMNVAGSCSYRNDSSELNLPLTTQFMGPPPAGHLLGYYHGRMYVAVGENLFYSEPYAYELFDLRRYLSFDGRITLFAPIEDRDNPGIFIGTDTSTCWLNGVDPDEFKMVPGVNYGAIIGAMTNVDGAMYADHGNGARMLPMWLSMQGICVGLPGGTVQNITRSKYFSPVPAQSSGCALFKPDSTQFVAVANY